MKIINLNPLNEAQAKEAFNNISLTENTLQLQLPINNYWGHLGSDILQFIPDHIRHIQYQIPYDSTPVYYSTGGAPTPMGGTSGGQKFSHYETTVPLVNIVSFIKETPRSTASLSFCFINGYRSSSKSSFGSFYTEMKVLMNNMLCNIPQHVFEVDLSQCMEHIYLSELNNLSFSVKKLTLNLPPRTYDTPDKFDSFYQLWSSMPDNLKSLTIKSLTVNNHLYNATAIKLFYKGINPKLSHLEFKSCDFFTNDSLENSNLIFTNIETTLDSISFSDCNMKHLINKLAQVPDNILSIDLSGTQLLSLERQSFIQVMALFEYNIKRIKLLSDDPIEVLSNLAVLPPNITTFDASNINLNNETINYVSTAFSHLPNQIETVDLSNNNLNKLTPSSLSQLWGALKPSVKKVILCGNNLAFLSADNLSYFLMINLTILKKYRSRKMDLSIKHSRS